MGKFRRLVKATIGVLIAMSLVSLLFPQKFGAQRTLVIDAPAAKIYALIEDPREWKKWSPWSDSDPAMTMSFSGAASGVGAQWSWQSASEGSGSMKFTGAQAGRRLDYSMIFESGTPAQGSFELQALEDGKTKVTWRFEGDTGYNPIARWFGLLTDKMVGPYFEKGLAKLARVAGASGK